MPDRTLPPPRYASPCVWPDCLTAEQQQTLAENVRRSMLGEEGTGPDPQPDCDCQERLAAEFGAHAEESLQIANDTFDAVVQSWPKE